MKYLLSLAVFLTTCTMMALTQQPAQPERPKALETPYYPLNVGTKWVYRAIDVKSTEEKKDPRTKADEKKKRFARVEIVVEREAIYQKITKDKKDKDVIEQFMGYLLRSTSGGKLTRDHVVVLPDGIYRIHSAGTPINPPLKFFQFEGGKPWECDSETRDRRIKGTFTLTSETIRVPAGEFPAFLIALRDGPADGPRLEIDTWYAKGVGMVKQRVKAKNSETVLELERFEPAK